MVSKTDRHSLRRVLCSIVNMEYVLKFIVGAAAFIGAHIITRAFFKAIGSYFGSNSDLAGSDSREEVAKNYWKSVKKEQNNGNI